MTEDNAILKCFVLKCSVTFRSPGRTALRLCFEVTTKDCNKDEIDYETPLDDIYCGAFSEACRIIRDLPLLANVKRLYIHHTIHASEYTRVTPIRNEVGRLFKSLGPSEKLALERCDMRPYFPSIQELTISHLLCPPREGFEAAIVGLAKSRHALGIPFKRMRIRMELPRKMERRLWLWVGSVYCYSREYYGD